MPRVPAHENPFAVERTDSLPFVVQGTNWDELLPRLQSMQWRGAIVGPHGHGKTTMLEELERRLEMRGECVARFTLNSADRKLPVAAFAAREVILLDGAEQLSPWAWRKFVWATRHARGLVITTHRHGRMPTWYECRTSPELLVSFLNRLAPNDIDTIYPIAERLLATHEGNIRMVLRCLYDHYAGRPVHTSVVGATRSRS